jgi:ABC-type Fe3+ transport system permease subunit
MQGEIPIPDPRDQKIIVIVLAAVVVALFLGAAFWPYFSEAWEELKNELKNLKR